MIVWLLVAGGLLAAADGVLSNMAAGSLPEALRPSALPLFLGVTLVAIGVAVGLYLLQSTPRVEAANRRHFLTRLQSRYGQRREDAPRGAALVALRITLAAGRSTRAGTAPASSTTRHGDLTRTWTTS